jgi:hypothetical protein
VSKWGDMCTCRLLFQSEHHHLIEM